ncbi:Mus7/MMS22 family-domain-containing protein [Jimgerdemannia flammicorona]|uniref:Mus7/MMS22 family-domain-containing protein n=1 Tax=Jimgerdemannia flammicorona TaxID=994334 RepID=A0A433QNN7_9FUNG|nr:Mus7/MMS22 family-domain-containing protein [Jimgerdemannia flammicorona]
MIPESPPFRFMDTRMRKTSFNDSGVDIYRNFAAPPISAFSLGPSQEDEDQVSLVGHDALRVSDHYSSSSSEKYLCTSFMQKRDAGPDTYLLHSSPRNEQIANSLPNERDGIGSGSAAKDHLVVYNGDKWPLADAVTSFSIPDIASSATRSPSRMSVLPQTPSTLPQVASALAPSLALTSSPHSQGLILPPTFASSTRTFRKRRDVQVRPFTVEKARFRASLSRTIDVFGDVDEVPDSRDHYRRKKRRKDDSIESVEHSDEHHDGKTSASRRHRPLTRGPKNEDLGKLASGVNSDEGYGIDGHGKENTPRALTRIGKISYGKHSRPVSKNPMAYDNISTSSASQLVASNHITLNKKSGTMTSIDAELRRWGEVLDDDNDTGIVDKMDVTDPSSTSDTDNELPEVGSLFNQDCTKRHGSVGPSPGSNHSSQEPNEDGLDPFPSTRRRTGRNRNGHRLITNVSDVNAKRLRGALPASYVTVNKRALELENAKKHPRVPYHLRSPTPPGQLSSSVSRSVSLTPFLPSSPPPLSPAFEDERDSDRSHSRPGFAPDEVFTDEDTGAVPLHGEEPEDQHSDDMDENTYGSSPPGTGRRSDLSERDLIDRMVTRRNGNPTKRKSRTINGSRKRSNRNVVDVALLSRKRPHSGPSRDDTRTWLRHDGAMTDSSGDITLSPDRQIAYHSNENHHSNNTGNELLVRSKDDYEMVWLDSDIDDVDHERPATSPSMAHLRDLRRRTRTFPKELELKSRSKSKRNPTNPSQQKTLRAFFTMAARKKRAFGRRTTATSHSRQAPDVPRQRSHLTTSHLSRTMVGSVAKTMPPKCPKLGQIARNGTAGYLQTPEVEYVEIPTSRKVRWKFVDDSNHPSEDQPEWVRALVQSRESALGRRTAAPGILVLEPNVQLGIRETLGSRTGRKRMRDPFENAEPASLVTKETDKFYESKSRSIPKEHWMLRSESSDDPDEDDLDIDMIGDTIQAQNSKGTPERSTSWHADVGRDDRNRNTDAPSSKRTFASVTFDSASSRQKLPHLSAFLNVASANFVQPSKSVDSIFPINNWEISNQPSRQPSIVDFLSSRSHFPGYLDIRPLPGGIHFGRDTYIGRGSLEALTLQWHVLHSAVAGNRVDDVFLNIVETGTKRVFDTQVALSAPFQEMISLLPKFFYQAMDNVMRVLESERRHMENDPVYGNRNEEDSVLNSLALECANLVDFVTNFAVRRVPFLSTVERTKFKDVLLTECSCLSRRFRAMFELKSFYRSDNQSSQSQSYILAVRLSCAFVDWAARLSLMDKTDYSKFSMISQSKDLMRLLVTAGSAAIETSLRTRSSTAVIDDAVVEGWFLLINVLDHYAWRPVAGDLDGTHPSNAKGSPFWTLLNEVLMADPIIHGFSDPWSRGELAWAFLFAILPLYQFDIKGVSDVQVHGTGNWTFIEGLLQASSVLQPSEYEKLICGTPLITLACDNYVRALFSRCHTLLQWWSWRVDKGIILLLYQFFENRKFNDLISEEDSSFPNFFKHFTGDIPRQIFASDTCFHILLKIIYIAFNRECTMLMDNATKSEQSIKIKKFVSQLTPTQVMTLQNLPNEISGSLRRSAGGHSYTSLGNQCNLILLMTHAIQPDIRSRSIIHMKSFLKFEDSDLISRRIFFEAFAWLAIIYKYHGEPLQNISDCLNEKLAYICHEYLEREKRHNIPVVPSPFFNRQQKNGLLETHTKGLQTVKEKLRWDCSQQELLELIKSVFFYYTKIVQAPGVNGISTVCSETSLLSQGWKIILNPNEPFPVSTRLYAMRFIKVVLSMPGQKTSDLRSLNYDAGENPDNSRVPSGQQVSAAVEDSQDTEFPLDDFDYNALDVDIALPGQTNISKCDQANRPLAEIVNAWVANCLHEQMVSNQKSDYRSSEGHHELHNELLRATIDCVSDAARLLVAHGMRSWGDYLNKSGPPFWALDGKNSLGRKNRLLFMNSLCEKDPGALQTYEDQFLAVWFQTIAEVKISFQHLYTNALLNLRNPPGILFNLPVARSESDLKYHLGANELHEIRPALIAAVLSNMGDELRRHKEEAPQSSWKLKKKFQGYLRHLFVSLREIYQETTLTDRASHVSMVHTVIGNVIQHCMDICYRPDYTKVEMPELQYFFSTEFPPPNRPLYLTQRLRRFAKLNFASDTSTATALLNFLHGHLDETLRLPRPFLHVNKNIIAMADALRNASTDSDRATEWNSAISSFRIYVCYGLFKRYIIPFSSRPPSPIAVPASKLVRAILETFHEDLPRLTDPLEGIRGIQQETLVLFVPFMECLHKCLASLTNVISKALMQNIIASVDCLIRLISAVKIENRDFCMFQYDSWLSSLYPLLPKHRHHHHPNSRLSFLVYYYLTRRCLRLICLLQIRLFLIASRKWRYIDNHNSEWSTCFHRVVSDTFNAAHVMLTNAREFPALDHYTKLLKSSQLHWGIPVPPHLMLLEKICAAERNYSTNTWDVSRWDDETEVYATLIGAVFNFWVSSSEIDEFHRLLIDELPDLFRSLNVVVKFVGCQRIFANFLMALGSGGEAYALRLREDCDGVVSFEVGDDTTGVSHWANPFCV